MAVNVLVTAQALSQTSPENTVVEITFTYSGTTITPSDTTIYYSATLSDGTNTENVFFPYTIPGTDIPASETFAYVPSVSFSGTITGSDGKVYYKP
jgi:hypothetical protein